MVVCIAMWLGARRLHGGRRQRALRSRVHTMAFSVCSISAVSVPVLVIPAGIDGSSGPNQKSSAVNLNFNKLMSKGFGCIGESLQVRAHACWGRLVQNLVAEDGPCERRWASECADGELHE